MLQNDQGKKKTKLVCQPFLRYNEIIRLNKNSLALKCRYLELQVL